MTIPFPFEALLAFSWLGIMLLIGIFLRAKIPFIQRFLFPSCLLGGLIGLVFLHSGIISIETSLLEAFAYHFFNISFISVGLTIRTPEEKAAYTGKEMFRGSLWMALIEGITIPVQALAGGLLVILFNYMGYNLFKTFGFFAPLGFTEGPGQALSIGKVWENFGFEHAATIGLTFATVGFLFAFFVGVPLANWGIKKGRAAQPQTALPKDLLTGVIGKNSPKESAGTLTMHSANVETLAFQLSLVGLVYLLTYGLVHTLGGLLQPELATTLWGFFFFLGMLVAQLVRAIVVRIGYGHLVDGGIQRRITGWSVDFLILSTVMAVQMVIVWRYIVPISVICLFSGVLTTIVVVYLGNRIWSQNLERTLAIYGTVTGTVSTGLLLLRIVDPEFRTSTAMELGYMTIFASVPVLGTMLLVSAPVLWGWSVELTLVVFAGMMLVCLALLKLFKMWGENRYKSA
ncbi:MAG TPA: sodium/glutamate symporter [Spirochaetota bacterium]|nr:sodium/glutamate symporter [Spirochaetota bacterium]